MDSAPPPPSPSPPPPSPTRRPLSAMEAALVAEACSKTDLVWVRPAGRLQAERYRAAWHIWHDDAVCLVYGTGEQTLPLLSGEVEVVARSKDSGAQVIGFVAQVDTLTSSTPEWDAAAQALSAARLNALEAAQQRERWIREATICLLRPVAVTVSAHGDDDTPRSGGPPPGGPGTTLDRTPFHLGGRRRRALRVLRRKAGPST